MAVSSSPACAPGGRVYPVSFRLDPVPFLNLTADGVALGDIVEVAPRRRCSCTSAITYGSAWPLICADTAYRQRKEEVRGPPNLLLALHLLGYRAIGVAPRGCRGYEAAGRR